MLTDAWCRRRSWRSPSRKVRNEHAIFRGPHSVSTSRWQLWSGAWTEATFADCRKDSEAVFDALLTDAEKDVIDTANIGVAGHSLGGYTVVRLG